MNNSRFGDLAWKLVVCASLTFLVWAHHEDDKLFRAQMEREHEIYKDLAALAEATKQNTEAINHLSAVGEIHTQAIKQLVKDDIFSGKATIRFTTSYQDLPGVKLTTEEVSPKGKQ
jgi:hypothetical protein